MRWFIARCPAWLLVPALDHEFRRLLVWSYVLAVRVRVLQYMVAMSAWFTIAGLAAILRRQSDTLATDIAALGRAIRGGGAGDADLPGGRLSESVDVTA